VHDGARTQPAGTPAVEARGVSYHHRDRRSSRTAPAGIDAFELDVGAGEIVGVIGPNGAGKSTLLRVLATILPPQHGTLRLLGDAAAPARRTLRRRIGYAGDDAVHFHALDGYTNALAFACAAGMERAAAAVAVRSLLARFDLETRGTTPVRTYSHGMRRKLLLVEALAHAPELVLLDEPTLGLDEHARTALLEVLRQRAADGTAVVMATNELDTAAALCTRVVFLLDGRVALQGEPAGLLRTVAHRTVISVALHGQAHSAPRFNGPGRVQLGDDHASLELHTPADSSVLPAFCAALIEQQVDIRSITVRGADLRDVFLHVTGEHWSVEP
jgi:ABC-2 type transport system ATP-binding protein